jgi:hypothetical protein
MINSLFVAWRGSDPEQGWGPVGCLERADGVYRFCYTQGARLLPGFSPFSGMRDLDQVYESTELFPLFANRLLSKSRPEYEDYLRWSGLDPVSQPDPLAILGVTEGRRETDLVEVFPCPIPDAEGNYQSKFFVHGVRWLTPAGAARLQVLEPGEHLRPMPDLKNQYDAHAMGLHTARDAERIGYVPRYLAQDVAELLGHDEGAIQVWVERVNADAPLRQRVLCSMRARWPQGFVPCHGEAFEPIPSSAAIQ